MADETQFLTPGNILILFLVFVTLAQWVQLALLRTRMSSRLVRIEERLHEMEQRVDRQAKTSREVTSTNERLIDATNDSKSSIETLRRDIVRLADDVRGEVGMSRAIELARAGATKEAVSDATGLSLEEAEAIVTFHGRSKG